MLHWKLPQGIQGAKCEAVRAFGLKVKPVYFQPAPLQKYSVSIKGHSATVKLPFTRQNHTRATTAEVGSSAAADAVSESSPATAIVLGASIAGLLSAAALSDYVESVIVLDKDAFVSENLPSDELKEVMLSTSPCGANCSEQPWWKHFSLSVQECGCLHVYHCTGNICQTSQTTSCVCSNFAALGMIT